MMQEVAGSVASHAAESKSHGLLAQFVHGFESVTEIVSVIIIAIGVTVAVCRIFRIVLFLRHQNPHARVDEYKFVRLGLARFLALALEFQLAADIIATSVSPSWDQLGRLGAIALIRTFLNYFLGREMEERETADHSLDFAAKKAE
jgi:uncharacterized membrane protein